MITKNYVRGWISKEKNQLIEGICLNTMCHTEAFRDRLWMLISARVPPEFVGAVFAAMLSKDALTKTAIEYCVSESYLSKLIKQVKGGWDEAFSGWKFVPYSNDAWKVINYGDGKKWKVSMDKVRGDRENDKSDK